MTEPTDNTISPDEFSDAFDAWIGGATLAQKSIEIYGNPALFAEYEKLSRELEVLKAQTEAVGEEVSMADSVDAEIEAKEAELVALYEKWQASKSTWTVRGVPMADSRELSGKYPDQDVPELPKNANEIAKVAYAAAQAAYDANVDGRNYAILERCVMKIEFADGRVLQAELAEDEITIVKPAITAAQLTKLRERLGEVQYIKLIGASKLASLKEPVIPAPFSRSSSKPDQT